jgi:hypothetical protein
VKLLFLDFDGVLHDVDAVQITYDGGGVTITGERLFSRLPLLEDLVARMPDAHIVVSSSWQSHYSIAELRARLGSAGHRVVGTTRSLMPPGVSTANRFQECQAVAMAMGATDWLIVDDQPSAVFGAAAVSAEMMALVVWTDPVIGLTDQTVATIEGRLT